jgi:hypothetical protein
MEEINLGIEKCRNVAFSRNGKIAVVVGADNQFVVLEF